MSRRWMGVALLMGWLGAVASAPAQAPVPEPLPCAPSTVPTAGPPTPPYEGPLPPQAAPHGPPDCMVLPDSIPGAFTNCPPAEECSTYFYLGARGQQRQRPGHGSVAVIDRLDPTNLDTGAVPQAERFLTSVLSYNDVSPAWGGGIEGTIGYTWGDNSLELTGFYIFDRAASAQKDDPGRLDLPFTHPPLGFEGDNGLWLQADRARITLTESMGNAEFNYRYDNQAITAAELIFGIRYTEMKERLDIFTDDDGLTIRDINGNPDPHRQATYQVNAHNHFAGPQLGFEWHLPLLSFVQFSWLGKAALGVDYVDLHYTLTRGDGFVGRVVDRWHTDFAEEYETGAFLDFWLCERGRLRAGYTAFWMVDVVEAAQQVNFDLAHQASQPLRMGSVFYHGPVIEMEFMF
jgi:hypothetical protein